MKRLLFGASCWLLAGLTGIPALAEYSDDTMPLPILQYEEEGRLAAEDGLAAESALAAESGLAAEGGLSAEGGLGEFDSLVTPVRANHDELTKGFMNGHDKPSPFMRVYSVSLPPIGYVRFCERNPSECVESNNSSSRVELTEERWQELTSVNRFVNQKIYPITDEELYGRVEFWTYPNGKGDCEDYVLLKRRILMERGWPMGSLVITVVLDEEGAGHAILTARTTGGDFILDNKREDVLAWSDTPYRFLKRQSSRNPQVWMSLYPETDGGAVAAFSSDSTEAE